MNLALKHIYESSNMVFLEQMEVNKILKNYDLNIIDVEKIRSIYMVAAEEGFYCLKKIGNGEKRAIKSISIMNHLKTQGFNKVTNPLYCSSGEVLVKRKSSSYYLADWIDAAEVDFDNIGDIMESVRLLAEFHNKAKGFQTKIIKLESNIGKLPKLYNEKTYFLNNIKESLDRKSDKNSFDILYHENMDYYIHQAQLAANILKNSDYDRLCEKNKNELYICHDSFYYQNILKDEQNNYYLIDLESCLYDLPLVDLGKFLRRIMANKKYLWDFDLCRSMLFEYRNVRKLDEKEYKIILSMLVFPYKFYKLGRKKYLKKKKWKNERFLRKLNRILEYKEQKERFIESYIEYYDIKL